MHRKFYSAVSVFSLEVARHRRSHLLRYFKGSQLSITMPGFIDAHVHFADVEAASMALLTGATTVRTMNVFHFLEVEIRDGGI